MIHDTVANASLYFGPNDLPYKALQFAAGFDPSQPDGRYEIDGDKMYALVTTYNTRQASESRFESHRKYIDIQLLLNGCEFIDVSLDAHLDITTAYSEQKDVTFYAAPKYTTSLLLQPGQFSLLYPHDIHRPCMQIDQPKPARKLVVKVQVNA